MISLAIVAIMIFLATFTRRNTWAGIAAFVGLAYLVGAAGPDTTDYATYAEYYKSAANGVVYFEKGYHSLGLLASQLGMDYAQFRLCLAFLATLFLYLGVRRFTSNLTVFALAYYFSVLFMDIIQVRNYVAICLVVFAVSLVKHVNIRNMLAASVMCFIAAQFHAIGYVFFLALLIRCIPEKHFKSAIFILTGLVTLAMAVIEVIGAAPLTRLLGKIAGTVTSRPDLVVRITALYTDKPSLFRIAGLFFTAVTGLVFCWYVDRTAKFSKDDTTSLYTLVSGFMASFLALPMLFMAYDYSRIQRNGFLFVMIIFALYLEKNRSPRVQTVINGSLCYVFTSITYFVFTGYLWRATEMLPYLYKLF